VSYDLAVFDPAVAPATPREFRAWFREQTQWRSDERYDDPERTTVALRRWFFDMLPTYPAISGPHAPPTSDDSRTTGYSIGAHLIYVDFRWSQADLAREIVLGLAKKHRVGFYDVSSTDGGVWLPRPGGKLARAFRTGG
jgi:hypothetical protein